MPSYRYLLVDADTGARVRGGIVRSGDAGPLFVDYKYVLTNEVSYITLPENADFNYAKTIDCVIGGRVVDEDDDFTRNVAQNRIEFSKPLSNIKVKIRLWFV